MKTKTIPFDLELAKKIQSGEIEGRIVTKLGWKVDILSFNVKSPLYPIAAIMYNEELGFEQVFPFRADGAIGCSSSEYGSRQLFIELPEETLEFPDITTQEGFSKAFTKHEFKAGDKIKVCCHESSENVIRKHNGEILIVECVLENGISAYNDETGLFLKFDEIEHFEEKQEVSNGVKHEFKPFDKVLVREDESDVWECRLFDRFFQDKGGLGYCCQDGVSYDFCIPYEGNERLVGTTDNPE